MRKLPKAITHDQYLKLLKQASKETDPELKYKNLTILILLYEAGLRVSDLTHLKLENIDLNSKTMAILQSKGSKDRIVPITQNMDYAIRQYLKHRPKTTNPYLIPGRNIKGKENEPIVRSGVNNMIKALSKTARVKLSDGSYPSPHSLRHGFATNNLKTGLYNLEELRRLLGHSSIATTSIYTYVEIDDLVNKAQKTPLDSRITALYS